MPSTPQIAVNVRVGVTTLSCSSFHVTPDADTMKMCAALPMRVVVATARRSKRREFRETAESFRATVLVLVFGVEVGAGAVVGAVVAWC